MSDRPSTPLSTPHPLPPPAPAFPPQLRRQLQHARSERARKATPRPA